MRSHSKNWLVSHQRLTVHKPSAEEMGQTRTILNTIEFPLQYFVSLVRRLVG